jgi:sugar-specific transcriptional regulator TrmB
MLEKLLQTLGLNSSEIITYLALAELGKASASVIAKRAQIPRSTTYTAFEGLLKRGLVSIEQASEGMLYIANNPQALTRMIQEEKRESELSLQAKVAAVNEIMPMLNPYFKRENYSVPKLQFFEGTSNVNNMLYDHCRAWQQSIACYDNIWWGYQDHHFVETYREWLDFYWATMQPDEKICLLSNKSETEKKLKSKVTRRSIKTVPKQFQVSSTVWTLGEYVITIMTRQKPHYAFQLQDSVFAANQRMTFQLLWSVLE